MVAPPDLDQPASLDGPDKPTTASFPFDDPKADLIIRSSDNIHFYVHKLLLSIVSPVFEGMFALPNDTSQELYDDRPCLPVSDDSSHLLCLLSWCDPRCKRPLPTLDNLTMALEIADKYSMDSIFDHAHRDLLVHDSVESEPLRVFAIAIRFRLDEIARKAAQGTSLLSLAACENSSQFKYISAFAVHNLHMYHFKCKMAVRGILASTSWTQEMKTMASLMSRCSEESKGQPHTHGVEYFSLKRLLIMEDRVLWVSTEQTAPWWSEYMIAKIYRIHEQPSGFRADARTFPQHASLLKSVRRSISLDKCNQCRDYGYARLIEVTERLANLIDEAISKVPFEVEY